jgi:uncharacterized protein
MTHCFKINNEYMLFDVESSALMFVDKLIFDIINNSDTLYRDYPAADIEEARAEISQLTLDGIIDGFTPDLPPAEKSSEIKSLCIHISHDCNLRCKYCFAGTGNYHGQRLNIPLDVAKKAIDFLIANSGDRHNLEVDFFGGEPLMNFDVLKATVEYAKQQASIHNKTFKFTTTTNGVLLSKEVSDYLNAEMDNVVLSLDGRKDINDAVRPTINGKGSFDVIVDKYKYFASVRGDKSYFLRGTFTHDNCDFCEDVLYMADLGFTQVSVEPVVLPDSHPLALTEDDIEEICENYEKLAKIYVERRQSDDTWFSFFHFNIDLENGPCYKKRLVGCGAGSEYMAVTPEGNIYPCHQFAGEADFLLGNVDNPTLDESRRDIFRKCSISTKPVCQNCWAKYQCSGGCSANAIHFNGDVNVPYALSCQLMKKRLECALYVYAKEHKND